MSAATYFNIADLKDGTRVYLEKDGTGRYIWARGQRESILGCYDTRAEARQELRTDERFGVAVRDE